MVRGRCGKKAAYCSFFAVSNISYPFLHRTYALATRAKLTYPFCRSITSNQAPTLTLSRGRPSFQNVGLYDTSSLYKSSMTDSTQKPKAWVTLLTNPEYVASESKPSVTEELQPES